MPLAVGRYQCFRRYDEAALATEIVGDAPGGILVGLVPAAEQDARGGPCGRRYRGRGGTAVTGMSIHVGAVSQYVRSGSVSIIGRFER
jgi:hypothetical protein